jgi:hypothetical protein
MPDALLFFHENASEATRFAEPYSETWDVFIAEPNDEAIDFIAERKPLATMFCLNGGGHQSSVDFAKRVLADSRALRPLMVFIVETSDQSAEIKQEIPNGVFVHEAELTWVIKHLTIKL